MEDSRLSKTQLNALVLLRVLIGWHFLYEGIAKFMKPAWSAAGLLSQARGPLAGLFGWIADTPAVLDTVNMLNMYGLMAIGLGLIVGCMTKTASYSGVLLLVLFYFCNPPWVGYFYSIPAEGNYLIVNKNLVEAAALWVVALTGSGKYLGIDFLIAKWRAK